MGKVMAVVCVDVGTTVIKAVGYGDDGTEAAIVRRATTVNRPAPGWAEQCMPDVWDCVADSVRTVVDQMGLPVAYIAVTAQGDGCWLVDAQGEPTGAAILWNDGRASEIVDEWSQRGVLDRAFAINGSLTFAGLPNAILTWLRRHDPGRLERSAASLTCGGWIFAQLTDEIAADESDASAPFLDVHARRYSAQLLQLYDMAWARRMLPDLRDDRRRIAALTAAAAHRVHLPEGTPVVMAPYDIATTAIGVGAVQAGQACSILGTTLCTEVVTTTPDLGVEPAGLTIAFGVENRYLRAFPTLAGGEVIQWACDLLQLTEPDQLTELALRGSPGAGGLIFLPYLSPAGERAPFLDPLIRGTIVGLTAMHRREEVARAVLEGLSFVVADCLTASRAHPIDLRVTGGGAASAGWLQLIADITGIPVRRSADTEAGARGAFLVGLVATGEADTMDLAVERHVRARDSFQPHPAATAYYTDTFADFIDIRQHIAALGPRLASLRARRVPAATGARTPA